ncbi:MAG: hypothetical protein ABIL25_10005 [candidate division WOR-3 bacterium]
MSDIAVRFRLGRLVWTVLVTLYFLIFFRNFFADAAPGNNVLPTVFAYLLVAWLAVEYYLGSPFFQSGLVEASALWRGVFAFFVYPFLGYLAADSIWWRWTQMPVPAVVPALPGFILFGVGTYLRLRTLFDMARMSQTLPQGRRGRLPSIADLPMQRLCRHPRYLATLLQLVGAALVFSSWGGLVLVGLVGYPLILLQARHEDRQMSRVLKQDAKRYFAEVPFFWPRFRPGRTAG